MKHTIIVTIILAITSCTSTRSYMGPPTLVWDNPNADVRIVNYIIVIPNVSKDWQVSPNFDLDPKLMRGDRFNADQYSEEDRLVRSLQQSGYIGYDDRVDLEKFKGSGLEKVVVIKESGGHQVQNPIWQSNYYGP